MIGNDIVDLNLAKRQSNWKRKGFLEKIFTKKEQEFIKNAKDSFTTVWLLWSMKESAYKIYSRQNNIRFYAPKQFECEIYNLQQMVKFNSTTYFTTSTISRDSIHTIATLNADKQVVSDFFKLKSNTYTIQNNATYKNLKSAISNQFNIPIAQLKIEKDNNGVPHVNRPNTIFGVPTNSGEWSSISISHHGIFGAYAFLK